MLPRDRIRELGEDYKLINPVYNETWSKKEWLKHLNKISSENKHKFAGFQRKDFQL